MVLIGVVVLVLHGEGGLKRTGISADVVAVGVALIGSCRSWVAEFGFRNSTEAIRAALSRGTTAGSSPGWRGRRRQHSWRLEDSSSSVASRGVYLIGLTASLAGFALAAPTPASLRRDQEQLDASGKTLNLLESLGGSPGSR